MAANEATTMTFMEMGRLLGRDWQRAWKQYGDAKETLDLMSIHTVNSMTSNLGQNRYKRVDAFRDGKERNEDEIAPHSPKHYS